MIVLMFACTHLFLTSRLPPIAKPPPSCTSMVARNYVAIWSFGKLKARAQGQMAPGKPCPGGRGRQSAADCLNTGMQHPTSLESYWWPFLESMHWNTLKASKALPTATVRERCSVPMLCLLSVVLLVRGHNHYCFICCRLRFLEEVCNVIRTC